MVSRARRRFIMQRTTDRRLACAGAWVLCLWGAGHIITVDVLPLVFGVYLYEVDAGLLEQMQHSAFRFPLLMGETTAHRAFYGFSVWHGVSLISLGLLNLVAARRAGLDRRGRTMVYAIDVGLSGAFLVISWICFFALPVVGGALALVIFALALVSACRGGR